MLPRGDGAGQHLCEGDLGYKTKQKNKHAFDDCGAMHEFSGLTCF